MSMVSSSGMLVKRESTTRLPIKNSESCSNLKDYGILNFAITQEKCVDNIKKLVATNSISEETRKCFKPVRTRPGIMYELSQS